MTEHEAVDDVDEPAANAAAGATPVSASGRSGRFRRQKRVSKWDRPPDPHDWRFWVGSLGKVLIATGILLFGFVAYQLWGTGLETARAQDDLANQFEELAVADDPPASTTPPADGPSDTTAPESTATTAPSTTSTTSTTSETSSTEVSPSTVADTTLPEITDDDITLPVAVDLSAVAVEQPERRIVAGEVLARLEIPRIGKTEYIVPGVSLNNLKKGPGHYPDTPLPGQLGNAAIAGHRTTYGAPFFDVDQLRANDELIVTYPNGDRFVYDVTFTEVVSSSDYYVVATSDPNIAELTLTSCDPKYTARNRIVVHSLLNPAKSSNVGGSTFYELEPDETEIPGDDPVLSADEPDLNDIEITETDSALGELIGDDATSSDDVAPDDTTPNDTTPDDTTAPASDDDSVDAGATDDDDVTERPDGDITTATNEQPAPVDAFSAGWFDDRDAFSQIALWGILLTFISLLAYQVSKKTRHDSIGFLVCIAPFLFALYFFFQNVNRLLPPGI